MNDSLLVVLRGQMQAKSDAELFDLWVENDRERYAEEMFEAARQVLSERGVAIPPQNAPLKVPVAARAPGPLRRAIARMLPIGWPGMMRATTYLVIVHGAAQCSLCSGLLAVWGSYGWWYSAMPIVYAIVGVWLLAAGVLCLRWRPQGRTALLIYAWVILGYNILSMTFSFLSLLAFPSSLALIRGARQATYIFGNTVEASTLPLVLLWLLTQPPIRELFHAAGRGFEPQLQPAKAGGERAA